MNRKTELKSRIGYGYISYSYYFVIKMIFKDLNFEVSYYFETLIDKKINEGIVQKLIENNVD